MANTYTQIHIQAIFAVQNRLGLIDKAWRSELFRYITGIVSNHNHKMIAINGVCDHIHMLFGMRPTQSLSDLMQDVKSMSSKWINDKNLIKSHFSWQAGYGAFSYSKSQIKQVIAYISKQDQHHHRTSFIEEYKNFLIKFEVPYNEKYVFHPI